MTREEAIERLEFLKGVYSVDTEMALEMAIEALKGRHHSEEHKRKISDSLKRFYGERREE